MKQSSLIIVVPCHNEQERLNKDEFISFAKTHKNIGFIFVNDGSTDNTEQVLNNICAENSSQLRSINLPCNKGKAEAVRLGVEEAMESAPMYVGYWDADLATGLSEICRMIDILDSDETVDIVLGSRVKLLGFDIQRRMTRHYLGRVFATFASIALRLAVYDTQCGAKIFRTTQDIKDIFSKQFKSRWIFDVELLARFLGKSEGNKEKIRELPLLAWVDVAGSKLSPKDFVKAIFELWLIYLNEVKHRK